MKPSPKTWTAQLGPATQFFYQIEVALPVLVVAALVHFIHAGATAIDSGYAIFDAGGKDKSWENGHQKYGTRVQKAILRPLPNLARTLGSARRDCLEAETSSANVEMTAAELPLLRRSSHHWC